MFVDILDVKGSKTFRIEAEQVFGREGAGADIGVPDRTVSSRHARIYQDGANWYLEDLNSSNGTFVGGDRLSGRVLLETGIRFALCRYSYEVVDVAGEMGSAPTSVFDEAPLKPPTGSFGDNDSDFREASGNLQPSVPMGSGEMSFAGTGEHGGSDNFDARSTGRPSDDEVPADPDEPIVPYLLSAVPKAVAFYLAAIPVLLFNPVGTIKKSINEQPFDAMSPREIMAYAIPPGLLGVIIGSVGGIIMALVNGTFAVGLIISPLISAAIAIVVAVVTGFVFHPVLTWVIDFLKGHSDARSRTNFFILLQTAVPLGSIASGIAIFLALIPIPFISIVTPVLSLAATLILFFGLFVWYRYFEVHKVIPILILLGGAGACFGTITSMIDIIKRDVAGLGSGGASVADSPDSAPSAENAAALATITQQIDSLRAAGQLTPDVEAALRQQAQALSGGAPAPTTDEDEDEDEDEQEAGTEADEESTARPTAAAEEPSGSPTTVAPKATTDKPAKAETAPRGRSAYPDYARKRLAVEQAIERDPTLLEKRAVMNFYKELLRETHKAKQKHKVNRKRKSATDIAVETKVAERLAEAETFRATADVVDKLHKRIFGR